MKKSWTIFVIPVIMFLLALIVPVQYVVSLNIAEIVLFVIHCIVCYYYIKVDKKQ